MNRILLFVCFLLLFMYGFSQTSVTYNSAEILVNHVKAACARFCFILQHPDDENTIVAIPGQRKIITDAALRFPTRRWRTKNLIGDEQGVDLDLSAHRNWLVARRIDGAEQYFTRAYEFGYSKSADEHWLFGQRKDFVWCCLADQAIPAWYYNKSVSARHQGRAWTSRCICHYCGWRPLLPLIRKSSRKQLIAGVNMAGKKEYYGTPITSKQQYYRWWSVENRYRGASTRVIGKSYGEIGAEARAMHKSQGKAGPRRRGQLIEYFFQHGWDAPVYSLMDGIDTTWARITGGAVGLPVQLMKSLIIINQTGRFYQFLHLPHYTQQIICR